MGDPVELRLVCDEAATRDRRALLLQEEDREARFLDSMDGAVTAAERVPVFAGTAELCRVLSLRDVDVGLVL